jgi:hypothetical protein
LGSIAVQSLGVAAIALYQAARGNFNWEIHLLALSWRERLFIAAIPILPAMLLLRKRPFVSVGLIVYAVVV